MGSPQNGPFSSYASIDVLHRHDPLRTNAIVQHANAAAITRRSLAARQERLRPINRLPLRPQPRTTTILRYGKRVPPTARSTISATHIALRLRPFARMISAAHRTGSKKSQHTLTAIRVRRSQTSCMAQSTAEPRTVALARNLRPNRGARNKPRRRRRTRAL